MMTHPKILESLPDFAAGMLSTELDTQVRAHLEDCRDCTEWLEAYRALEAALPPASNERPSHPTSQTLARFAFVPESLDAETRATVTAHLDECFDCDEEANLCRLAVSDASVLDHDAPTNVSVGETPLPKVNVPSPRAWMLQLHWRTSRQILMAAGILLSVLGGGTILFVLRATPETFTLKRRSLSGVTTIEARRTIEATSSSVDPGANVTLRAKQVVLGSGFTVENGARLTIESVKE
ncbi:MAG TPA: zf-HC2 domain-containing protein [Vicinamibacteria bacterium]|nr:zf-HC2 domain-containing protein [Vicinamibacteria bacterium]